MQPPLVTVSLCGENGTSTLQNGTSSDATSLSNDVITHHHEEATDETTSPTKKNTTEINDHHDSSTIESPHSRPIPSDVIPTQDESNQQAVVPR